MNDCSNKNTVGDGLILFKVNVDWVLFVCNRDFYIKKKVKKNTSLRLFPQTIENCELKIISQQWYLLYISFIFFAMWKQL